MFGKIKFTYRAALDVVIAHVDWTLETEEDVLAWQEQYRAYFDGRFNRKIDLILELSQFHVSPRIATFFGRYRAEVNHDFVNRSYRVNQPSREKTYMYTSSALHGAPANQFDSIDMAIAALEADRQSSSKPPTSPPAR